MTSGRRPYESLPETVIHSQSRTWCQDVSPLTDWRDYDRRDQPNGFHDGCGCADCEEGQCQRFGYARLPVMLDLFSCRGVGAMGYRRAGFRLVGVDREPQPLYPFEHHVADALDFLASADLSRFAAIHASPPCQSRTTMSNKHRGKGGYTDGLTSLIGPVREALEDTGLPYVIENVGGARADMRAPITLTGGAFGLAVERPRLFESNIALTAPPHVKIPPERILGIYGRSPDGRTLWTRNDGSTLRAARTVAEGAAAMGITWPVDWRGITEAIPPAYTEHIGRQLHAHIVERWEAA